jgi:two-component system, OmpR family, alkaline phosphatase synthesis response regulator PhoP
MSKVILVVEDDPKSMTLTKDLLQISGYSTVQATDGKQGVVVATSTKPDLILMDIMMPKMDGYSACHELKSNPDTKNIPVIMLTAVGYDLNKKLAQNVGAQGYITKPFSRQELLDAISPLLQNA